MYAIEILSNPWFVGVLSSLITAILIICFDFFVSSIRAWFGMFSGQYLAVTWLDGDNFILIEDVACKHHGSKLSGRINGVAVFSRNRDSGSITEIGYNCGAYKFLGYVQERLFIISYQTKIAALHSAGALTLLSDSSGIIITGAWTGCDDGRVRHANCSWFRLGKKISSKKNRAKFLEMATDIIAPKVLINNNRELELAKINNDDLTYSLSTLKGGVARTSWLMNQYIENDSVLSPKNQLIQQHTKTYLFTAYHKATLFLMQNR